MAVSFWVKYKTKRGKEASRAAYKSGVFIESIDYDSLAALYPDINWLQCDNFPELQKKFLEDQEKNKNSVVSKSDLKESTPGTDIKPAADIGTKKKRGRPLKGDIKHTIEVNAFKREKNGYFLPEVVEKYNGDLINNNDLYISAVTDTIELIKNNFFAENPELIKKHPSIWFRKLCNTIKKNIPPITNKSNNPYVINALWDLYSDLCMDVGINRTIENFDIFTGLNCNDIEKIKKGSSPEYIELSQKIYSQCRNDIVGGLSSSFGSNPNQMFIAKAIYGLSENTIITHVSAASDVKKIDDIPVFCIEQNEKSK